jgi:hypothetical protein
MACELQRSAEMTKTEMNDTESNARIVGVTEAAEHFGISTLRVRHRLRTGTLKGFRDNRGHWQVRLNDGATVGTDRPLDGNALTDMLVEELLEAKDRIDEQDQVIKRLHRIVERQQKTLDQTLARLEALSAAQPTPEATERLRKTLDRLVALLEASLAQHEAANARAERFRSMMARAIELLETLEPNARAAALRNGKLSEKLGAAIDLGDRAVARAEASSDHAAHLDGMLERALAVAEQGVERQKQTELRLKTRDELLERSLSLIETAASRISQQDAVKRRWFALFGWRTDK